MFAGYIGQEAGLVRWQQCLTHHAGWLRMELVCKSWVLADGSTLACGWLRRPRSGHEPLLEETAQGIRMRTWVARPVDGQHGQTEQWSGDTNSVSINAIPYKSAIRIEVPMTTPEQFYHATHPVHGTAFGNDMRFFLRWSDMRLDERGLYSLMLCGTIVPPYTIAEGVRRIPNGHALSLRSGSTRSLPELLPSVVMRDWQRPPGTDPERATRDTLDRILGDTPRETVVYFSGGVDSGLMASRMAALGRTDVRLVNFSFGSDDMESRLASYMARHLGLRLEQVLYDPANVMSVLDRLAIDYPFPFGDYSVLPMNMLVRASLASSLGSLDCAVDGAGADDLFGVGLKYRQWKRWYTVPDPMRRLMSFAYAHLKLWESNSRAGRAGRVARRSVQMPLFGAGVFAQNSLSGIAYHPPTRVIQEINEAIEQSYGVLTEGIDPEDRFSMLFAMHDVVGRVAHKSYMLLRAHGARPLFPFIEPEMVRLSVSLRWDQKVKGKVTKAPLKALLAQQVPPEMVYRKKSGFIPPFETMLTTQPVHDYLHDVVLSSHNPMAQLLDRQIVLGLVDRAYRKQPLNLESYFFLWSVVFGASWLHQLMAS